MGEALAQLLESSGFSWPPAATALVSEAFATLKSTLARSAASPGDHRGGLSRSGVVVVPTEDLLDAAAALLDAAHLLHRHGATLPAFAVEGVQGRLLEAAVGAGSVELSA